MAHFQHAEGKSTNVELNSYWGVFVMAFTSVQNEQTKTFTIAQCPIKIKPGSDGN